MREYFFGVFVGSGCGMLLYIMNGGPVKYIREWSAKPYCITETIVDREYTRCWKVVEVAPHTREGTN